MIKKIGERPVKYILSILKSLAFIIFVTFLSVSILIMITSNSIILLSIIIFDEGVGLVTVIYDIWKNNLLNEIQPMIGQAEQKSTDSKV